MRTVLKSSFQRRTLTLLSWTMGWVLRWGVLTGSVGYALGQARKLKERAAASHSGAVILAIIDDVTNVDAPKRCFELHSAWEKHVRTWCGRLNSNKSKAFSPNHSRDEFLDAGFEAVMFDSSSRGLVLLGGAIGTPDYCRAHVGTCLA